MAHERITSNDVQADVIVHWDDDACVVDLGMIWDDPYVPNPQTSNDEGGDHVIERQVETDAGGRIEVPTQATGMECPLQAYRDSEGRWSIYMAFDRPRINGLIRTLRRARNKAFGADE